MNAMHYIISIANDLKLNLSAVLLLKIIVFAEIDSFKHFTTLLTGVKIVKGPFGPIPDGYKQALNDLKRNKKIIQKKDGSQTIYINLMPPDISSFSDEEINLLNKWTKNLCINFTSTEISELTHQNKYWDRLNNGDIIPMLSFFNTKQIFHSAEELDKINKECDLMGMPLTIG
jgi:hypothetical protein